MKCAFLRVGNNEPCHSKPTKKSVYCRMHNFLIKASKVKPCLRCGLGTCSKLQMCNKCGANNIRMNQRYHEVIKPFNSECHRLRQIEIIL